MLDGHGLARAVTLSSSSAAQPSTVRDLTVTGAATGVATEQGAHAVLQNVILSDNTSFGIDVGASAVATVISSTLFRNDVGARSFGRMDIRNSILTQNRRGLVATPAEALLSRYNALFANKEVAYENVVKGIGDLSVEVSFKAVESSDLRVLDQSPTTDRGDPADDFAREPAPNGRRINMGAFAGTEQAELSQSSSTIGSSPVGPTPLDPAPVDPTPPTPPTPAGHKSSGGCAVAAPISSGRGSDLGRDGLWGTLGLLALIARRRARRR